MDSYYNNMSEEPDDFFECEYPENEDMMQVSYSEMTRLMSDGEDIQTEYISEDDILSVLDMCSLV